MAFSDSSIYLGCGVYDVYFRDRCGVQRYKCRAPNVTGLRFSRQLNETSDAEITIGLTGYNDECCDCIGDVNPWQHEVAIFRDGMEVWTGPITEISFDYSNDTATFYAKDLSAWFDKRLVELLEEDYDVEDIDSKDVFEWLVNHAYCKDPWCMTWSFSPTGVNVTRLYYAFFNGERWGGAYPVIGDEIRDMQNYSVDWTVVDRHMYGGGLQTDPPFTKRIILLSNHWTTQPIVKVTGQNMSNRVVAAGGSGGNDGWYDEEMWIEPPITGPITPAQLTGDQRIFGLLESFESYPELDDEDTTEEGNAVTQAAWGKYQLSNDPFSYIQGGRLDKSAPVNFEDLIPGTIFEVRLDQTCRPFQGQYRLASVQVSIQGAADEVVDLNMEPVGVSNVRPNA